MAIGNWVVFKPITYCGVKSETYWTGMLTDRGRPARATNVEMARPFDTPREAYETAARNGISWWKVGKR